MIITTFDTAEAFLAAVRPALARHEAEHHMLLGVAEAHARDAAGGVPDPDLFALRIDDDEGFGLAAFMTGRRPLLVASDRDSAIELAPALCGALAASNRTPSHAIGATGVIEAIVHEWERRTGRAARVSMRQRAYRLTRVAPVRAVSGSLRMASADDIDLVADWIDAFEREALASLTPSSQPRAMAARRVAAGEVYLWCDPEPRTMAGSARPTARAIAVNAVYTPPEWRGLGYATACVAELSARLLDRGFEFCVLYTDLANPTSNAIYTRIGYQPVRDFLMYELPA